jgi:hypothetical protein
VIDVTLHGIFFYQFSNSPDLCVAEKPIAFPLVLSSSISRSRGSKRFEYEYLRTKKGHSKSISRSRGSKRFEYEYLRTKKSHSSYNHSRGTAKFVLHVCVKNNFISWIDLYALGSALYWTVRTHYSACLRARVCVCVWGGVD